MKGKEKGKKLKSSKDVIRAFVNLKKEGSSIDEISDLLFYQKDKLIDMAL